MGTKRRRMGAIFLLAVALIGGRLFLNHKKSTIRLARFHGHRIWDFIHSYVYLKWTSKYVGLVKYVLERPYILPGQLYRRAGNRLMQTHHSKVITDDTAKRIIDINSPIEVRNSEQVLPFEKARDIILKNSDHIVVTDCACRQVSENPCHPIDVCFYLGEPFADFLIEHKKHNARRVGVEEALELLKQERDRGRVHTAWFKDALGNRLYAICNCCSCCCMGFRALSHGFEIIASSGYIAWVDHDKCTLCGECENVCHFGAITVGDLVEINTEKCKGCGVCATTCPTESISLQEDATKTKPLILP
ncbi:MAG: 4Fe-4S binding protein [Firmicutes bacterium]|nr:4Fe-4S binding protein [Bacillota bacterium]